MSKLVLVFIGGGAGSLARYWIGVQATRAFGTGWPYGTFSVNLIGGFVMGVLAGYLAQRGDVDQEKWRLLLGVGLMGGFTTFSAFSLETAMMIEKRMYVGAFAYSAASVVLSVSALFAGLMLARRVFT
jgi:CrcB protein